MRKILLFLMLMITGWIVVIGQSSPNFTIASLNNSNNTTNTFCYNDIVKLQLTGSFTSPNRLQMFRRLIAIGSLPVTPVGSWYQFAGFQVTTSTSYILTFPSIGVSFASGCPTCVFPSSTLPNINSLTYEVVLSDVSVANGNTGDPFNSSNYSNIITIIINPVIASVAPISGATHLCVGSTTTLTNMSSGGTWSSSNTSIAMVSAGTVSGISAGIATISYTLTHDIGGCKTIATKIDTVKASSTSLNSISVCPNALPYSWNGLNFSAAGSQTAHLTNSQGCDSAATLNLTVKSNTSSTTNVSVCPSELPYSWNGLTFNAAGSQTKTGLTNSQGCDSAATLNLTVKTNTSSTTDLSICPSALPYVWNGLTFNAAGSQTKTGLTNSQGCDSSATLNLTVKSNTSSTTNVSVCPSELPYSWNGFTFNTAGSQTAHLTNAAGCDSSATLNLTVKTNTSSTTDLSICPSELPYSWNGLTFNAAGSQTKTGLTNSQGCDSSATLNLTVKTNTSSITTITACDSLIWNNITYTTSGTYVYTTTNIAGCDSTATLNLTITPCHCEDPCSWSKTGNDAITPSNYIGPRNGADFVIKTGKIGLDQDERIRVSGINGAIYLKDLAQVTLPLTSNNYYKVYIDGTTGQLIKGLDNGVASRTANASSPSQVDEKIKVLEQQVLELQTQVKALLEARNYSPCKVAQPSGTLEVVPTPFADNAKAIYSIDNFNGEASLQVADINGKVLKTFTINQAKGQIEIGAIQTSTSTVVLTIVSGGKVVVSKKSIKITE